jgi:hypothetical protein
MTMPLLFRRPWQRRYLRIFSVVWLVVIACILGVYGWFTWNQAVNGIEADGIVVDRFEGDGSPRVYVGYTTADGQPVRAELTGVVGSGRPRFDAGLETGDEVRIRYVASSPGLVRLASEPAVDAGPFWYLGAFLLFGIVVAVYAWWPGVNPGRRGA